VHSPGVRLFVFPAAQFDGRIGAVAFLRTAPDAFAIACPNAFAIVIACRPLPAGWVADSAFCARHHSAVNYRSIKVHLS
jgi:hypothetical protein